MAKIVVVEDDPDALDGLCDLIRQQGHILIPAEDAAVALKILEGVVDHVDLVATDICMPGMNGIELGRRIYRLFPAIKVVYFSAHNREGLHHIGLHLADDLPFFEKPYDRQILLELIAKILDSTGRAYSRDAP